MSTNNEDQMNQDTLKWIESIQTQNPEKSQVDPDVEHLKTYFKRRIDGDKELTTDQASEKRLMNFLESKGVFTESFGQQAPQLADSIFLDKVKGFFISASGFRTERIVMAFSLIMAVGILFLSPLQQDDINDPNKMRGVDKTTAGNNNPVVIKSDTPEQSASQLFEKIRAIEESARLLKVQGSETWKIEVKVKPENNQKLISAAEPSKLVIPTNGNLTIQFVKP
jgi:hypothetical protein